MQNVLKRISQDAKSHMLTTMPAGGHSGHFASPLSDPNPKVALPPILRKEPVIRWVG